MMSSRVETNCDVLDLRAEFRWVRKKNPHDSGSTLTITTYSELTPVVFVPQSHLGRLVPVLHDALPSSLGPFTTVWPAIFATFGASRACTIGGSISKGSKIPNVGFYGSRPIPVRDWFEPVSPFKCGGQHPYVRQAGSLLIGLMPEASSPGPRLVRGGGRWEGQFAGRDRAPRGPEAALRSAFDQARVHCVVDSLRQSRWTRASRVNLQMLMNRRVELDPRWSEQQRMFNCVDLYQ
jgi:hypothetical protein